MLTRRCLYAIGKRPCKVRLEQARQPPCLLPGQPDIGSLLRIGERIYAAPQARQEGPDGEDDQDAIDGGDGQQEGD
jgi:hypothetical protein